MLFLNIYTDLGYFIRTTHMNWIYKGWVKLINERQQETERFLGKKSKFDTINLLGGQWVHPRPEQIAFPMKEKIKKEGDLSFKIFKEYGHLFQIMKLTYNIT